MKKSRQNYSGQNNYSKDCNRFAPNRLAFRNGLNSILKYTNYAPLSGWWIHF
jgi:hypothetical protein